MKKKQRRKVMKMVKEEGRVPAELGDTTKKHHAIPPYPFKLARFQRRFLADQDRPS